MNIKSLLLGSAAALVAVSGARAADAVVAAEPEPMEYVRICDMYGAGYFYIPGTETCLKIGGYFRADIAGGELFDRPEDSYNTLMRFAPKFDAKSETEYGTLTAEAQVLFNFANGGQGIATSSQNTTVDPTTNVASTVNDASLLSNTGVVLDHAWIDLAGFRIGKADSAFTSFIGYTGSKYFGGVIRDSEVPQGPFDTNFISYSFNLAGASGVLSLEEGTAGAFDTNNTGGVITVSGENDEIQTYVPHVVLGLGYDFGVFDVTGVAAYDANNQEFAGKVKLSAKFSDQFTAFVMGGYKTDDGDDDVDQLGKFSDGTNYYGNWRGGDCGDDIGDQSDASCGDGYAVWAGGSFKFNDTAQLNALVAYDEGEDFSTSVNVDFQPVKDLHIIPEVTYDDNFDDDNIVNVDGNFGGTLRIQRNF